MEDLIKELATKGIITFSVKVRPSAHRTKFREIDAEGNYKIDIAAKPEDGKANIELIRFFAKICHTPQANVKILSGQTSRKKLVRIMTSKYVR